jgi:hypothetical protein
MDRERTVEEAGDYSTVNLIAAILTLLFFVLLMCIPD